MSLNNARRIILVLSGKGGVGKSSVTTQHALSLCLAGHNVGILDIDLTGPSIPRLLGIESSRITQAPGGWLPVEVHGSQTLEPFEEEEAQPATNGHGSDRATGVRASGVTDGTPKNTNGAFPTTSQPRPRTHSDPSSSQKIGSLHCMSLAFLLTTRSSAIIWRGPKKTAMVRQFLTDVLWPPATDYLLIDTPPGTSDEHISLVETLLTKIDPSNPQQMAGAVVVTTPQAVATADVRKEINFCVKTGVRVLGVVENMSGYVCECCGEGSNLFGSGGGELMCEELNCSFLGRCPVDGQWGRLVEEGRRPTYGSVKVGDGNDNEDEDEDEDEDEEDGEEEGDHEKNENNVRRQEAMAMERQREDGLLVEKYRNCSLCPIFEDISHGVIEAIEGETGAH